MLKLPPWFKQQWGVPGSDTPDGIRVHPQARDIYVDNSHPDASDTHDGTDPDHPRATITGGIAAMATAVGGQPGDILHIAAGDDYDEAVTIDRATHPDYCTIRGDIDHRFRPQWGSGSATEPCIVVGAQGWIIELIRFICPVTDAAVIIPNTQAPYTATQIGIRTHIRKCYFDGQLTGLYGIDLHGAPFDVQIEDCLFSNIDNAGNTAFAIVSTNTGFADARALRLLGNYFYDNDNHVDVSMNGSIVTGNIFDADGATVILDLRTGTLGENVVTDNFFGGDYSNVGGYWANAANPGDWNGNKSADIAEAEVADNGFTILPPA